MPQEPTKVVGRRVAAYLIDSLLYSLLVTGLWFAFTGRLDKDTSAGGGFVIGDTRYAFTSSSNRAIWVVLIAVLALLIFVILPGIRGWSPGKAATGIRLVGADGRPPGVPRAVIRYVMLLFVDGFPYVIPNLVGFVVALVSEGNQRVGDMVARTWVVRAEAAGRPIAELLHEAPAAQPATVGWQQPQQQPAPAQPAGWYADPSGQARLRWWDGGAWTENVSN
jgi:uncharacterized RDD family membrane protein YckC